MLKQSIEKGRQGKYIKIISFFCNCLENDVFGNSVFENMIFFGPTKNPTEYSSLQNSLLFIQKLYRKVARYTVKKVTDFHVFGKDVTYQTLPGRE